MLKYAVKLFRGVEEPMVFIFDDEAEALEFSKLARVYYWNAESGIIIDNFIVLIDVIKEDIKINGD